MTRFKKAFLILSGMFLFISCSYQEKATKMHPYLIRATVLNCEGCLVLVKAGKHTGFARIDSAIVRDGKFVLEGGVSDSGFYNVSVRYPEAFINLDVFLPADSISLQVDAHSLLREKRHTRDVIASFYHYTVRSTSPHQAEVEKYILLKDSLWNAFMDDRDLVIAQFSQAQNAGDKAVTEQWADSVNNFTYRFQDYMSHAAVLFMQQGVSPDAAIYAMTDNKGDLKATERFKIYYKALPSAHRLSPQGLYLEENLRENEARNQNNQRFVGSRIRNLDLLGSTPLGQQEDESHIFKNNKLTLVEFWASWCGPCRMEMPKYHQLYEQYKGKGFGIIAVSMDNRRDMWLKAVKQDGLNVHHISELKGANGDDMRRFEIKGIPANMLVDATGTIVAVDISRVDLKNKLQQTLKK